MIFITLRERPVSGVCDRRLLVTGLLFLRVFGGIVVDTTETLLYDPRPLTHVEGGRHNGFSGGG